MTSFLRTNQTLRVEMRVPSNFAGVRLRLKKRAESGTGSEGAKGRTAQPVMKAPEHDKEEVDK